MTQIKIIILVKIWENLGNFALFINFFLMSFKLNYEIDTRSLANRKKQNNLTANPNYTYVCELCIDAGRGGNQPTKNIQLIIVIEFQSKFTYREKKNITIHHRFRYSTHAIYKIVNNHRRSRLLIHNNGFSKNNYPCVSSSSSIYIFYLYVSIY